MILRVNVHMYAFVFGYVPSFVMVDCLYGSSDDNHYVLEMVLKVEYVLCYFKFKVTYSILPPSLLNQYVNTYDQ